MLAIKITVVPGLISNSISENKNITIFPIETTGLVKVKITLALKISIELIENLDINTKIYVVVNSVKTINTINTQVSGKL